MTRPPSLSFDHVADFYDETRAMPDHAIVGLMDAIVRELSVLRTDHILEVGIGTGRIARPLAERGIRVTGVDIAPRMMHRLLAQLGSQHIAPDLLLADATRLPLTTDSFKAAVTSHILHLIPAWQEAVAEILRVLAPNGILLNTYEDDIHSDWESHSKWQELLDARGYIWPRVRADDQSITAALTAAGGSVRAEIVAEWDETSTPAQELEMQLNRIHSWGWEIPDDIYFDCFPHVERWALEYYGGPDRTLHRRAAQYLQVWRFQ